MRTLDAIIAQLQALLPDLRCRYPIRSMGVFGSYVRGEQREDSDLDLLVELGDGMDLIAFVGLQLEISDALGLSVDLVEREALRPRFARHQVFPYLLRKMTIERPNQVWAMDITYIPMARGFVYLPRLAQLASVLG